MIMATQDVTHPVEASSNDHDAFDNLVEEAHAIKQRFLDPNLEWHRSHQVLPRLFFRLGGTVTILFGVILPVVAVVPDTSWPSWIRPLNKELVLSIMSIAIAALTGFIRLSDGSTVGETESLPSARSTA